MGVKFKASVRIDKIRDRQHLQAMSRHSLRQDEASKRRLRPGATLSHALNFSTLARDGIKGTELISMRNVVQSYDGHRARTNIAQTVQGGMGFHAMISVSLEWITADGGQLHDAENARNELLFFRALAWLQTWCGKDSVYAARLDLDETGGGTVDAFVMPVRIDGRTSKRTISTSKPLRDLRVKHGQRMSYVAMQTDWAEYACSHLDRDIVRGRSKSETLIDHLGVEEFKQAHAEAKRRADVADDQAKVTLTKVWKMINTAKRVGMDIEAQQRLTALEAQAEELAEFIRDRHSNG